MSTSTFKPLNQKLYRALSHLCPKILVQNEGCPVDGNYVPDWSGQHARLKYNINVWGETYKINCPFCSDTRHRLSINYRWGQYDKRTGSANLFLATCYNEDCLKSVDNRNSLHAMVYPHGLWGSKLLPAPTPERTVRLAPPPPIVLPPGIPLDQLSENCTAIIYLTERGFHIDQFARERGLFLAQPCDTSNPKLYEERIVVPIHTLKPSADGSREFTECLAGWQARMIREPRSKDERKYLFSTGLRKNQILYGLPSAVQTTDPIIIVEGVTDVWRIGPEAVALMGKTISKEQLGLIVKHFGSRTVVVWLDAEAELEAKVVKRRIEDARRAARLFGKVVLARCPPRREDPGDCTADEINEALNDALSLNKVTVEYGVKPTWT